ncbi:50S ribosomal protein L1 [Mycoplasmoides genitalium M6282]|nr:50S ribosomal protein L1 [Mycoplasmoides genitalium M6282]
MKKLSKKMQAVTKLIDKNKLYPIQEAFELIKKQQLLSLSVQLILLLV